LEAIRVTSSLSNVQTWEVTFLPSIELEAAASVIQLTYDDGNVEILNEDGKVLSKASLGQGASLMFPKTE